MTRRGVIILPALFLILAGLLAAGCGEEDGERIVRDPQRIVSLSPFVTEVLFALGVGDRIVGATEYCVYPEAAGEIPRIGDMRANYELIVGLRPDLVVATEGVYVVEPLRRLRDAGIHAVAVPSYSFKDGRNSIIQIGRLVNRGEEARGIVGEIDAAFERMETATRDLPKVRVLVIGWDDANITAMGKGTTVDSVVAAAGGRNVVTSDANNGYIRNFSTEEVLRLAPDVIIVTEGQEVTAERTARAKERWERYRSIPAVAAGRVHVVKAEEVERMAPRIVKGLSEVADILHPGVIKKREPAAP